MMVQPGLVRKNCSCELQVGSPVAVPLSKPRAGGDAAVVRVQAVFRETLQVLVAKFKHVFFVPGAAHLADTTLQHKTRSRTGSHSIKLKAMQPPCRVSTSGKE